MRDKTLITGRKNFLNKLFLFVLSKTSSSLNQTVISERQVKACGTQFFKKAFQSSMLDK